jgi:hypothetical protein
LIVSRNAHKEKETGKSREKKRAGRRVKRRMPDGVNRFYRYKCGVCARVHAPHISFEGSGGVGPLKTHRTFLLSGHHTIFILFITS